MGGAGGGPPPPTFPSYAQICVAYLNNPFPIIHYRNTLIHY
jgi:hypothetical protein